MNPSRIKNRKSLAIRNQPKVKDNRKPRVSRKQQMVRSNKWNNSKKKDSKQKLVRAKAKTK